MYILIGWSEEDDKKLFELYKNLGPKWVEISKEFKGKDRMEVKNRFYSTLRRLARNDGMPESGFSHKILLKYVDKALDRGHLVYNKPGRKKKHHRRISQITSQNFIPAQKRLLPEKTPQITEQNTSKSTIKDLITQNKAALEAVKKKLSKKSRTPISNTIAELNEIKKNISELLKKTANEIEGLSGNKQN